MEPDAANAARIHTTSSAARRIGVTRQTARNYADQGHFPNAHQLPGGEWRIPDSDIDTFLEKCRTSGRFPRQTTQATDIVTA